MPRIVLFLLCAIAARSHAQSLRFHTVGAEGLRDRSVNVLLEDRAGYLWIGTDNGLFSYDGHHLSAWSAHEGQRGMDIRALLEDHQGGIWSAARHGGLARIAPDRRSVSSFAWSEGPGGLRTQRPTCLHAWDEHTLMIGGEDIAIVFLDTRTAAFTYWNGVDPIHPAQALPDPRWTGQWCNFISNLDADHLAIGLLHSYDQRIIRKSTGLMVDSLFHYTSGLQTNTAFLVHEGRLIGAGWQPFLQVRSAIAPHTGTSTMALPDEATALAPWTDGRVAVGTKSSGLVVIHVPDGKAEHHRHNRYDTRTLVNDRVRCLLTDREGRLWVGTQKGLCVHDPHLSGISSFPLRKDGGMYEPDVTATRIVSDPDGTMHVLTHEGSIRFDGHGQALPLRFMHRGRSTQVNGLSRDGNERLWSTEYGVFTQPLPAAAPSPLSGRWTYRDTAFDVHDLFQVRDAFHDTINDKPFIVAGVNGYGVTLLDPQERTVRHYLSDGRDDKGLASNFTRRLLRAADGSYRVGTADGVYRWDPRRNGPDAPFERIDTGGPGHDVMELALASDGTVWTATRDGGVIAIGAGGTRSYPEATGHGGMALGIAVGQDGLVWCSTSRGLMVLDPQDGGARKVVLQGPFGEVFPGGPIAIHPDGRIACTAGQEVFLIDAEKALKRHVLPMPYLTALSVNDQPRPMPHMERTLDLASKERRLSVSLSALRLTGAAPLRFEVMLEGVDDVMRHTDAAGPLTWSSLPTGSFTLLARVIGDDGLPGETIRLMTVAVAAPLWQRWWFYALIAAAISMLAYAWSRYRIVQAMKLQAVRNRIASDLHDEVGSSLSSINIGSRLAGEMSSAENEQVRALLARIGETSSNSLRSISDIVWAIDPKNDEGEALVKRMRRTAHELLERKGVKVEWRVDGGMEAMKLPMELRKEVLLIAKEALHNASKYAEAEHVDIALGIRQGKLELLVRDDGRGFDPSLHPDGNGLGNMRRRAERMRGCLRLESAPGKGTNVALVVPLGST